MATRSRRKPTPPDPSKYVPVVALRDVVHFPGQVNTLHVVRQVSLRALRLAGASTHLVFVVSQRDMALEDPTPDDLYEVGTLSEVLQTIPLPDGSVRVALRCLQRAKVTSLTPHDGIFLAELGECEEKEATGLEAEAAMQEALQLFSRIVEKNPEIPAEAVLGIDQYPEAGMLADAIAHHLTVRVPEKQALLEENDHEARIQALITILSRELQVLELKEKLHLKVETELGQTHRDFYLREQLRIIQEELRGREDRVGEVEEYEAKLRGSGMPEEAREHARSEIRRLDRTPAASPEGMVLRNYLDTLFKLPWNVETEDRLNVADAARLLDERHHGLGRVKDRILDHLAVRQLRGNLRGPILCFQGPPGVGKTSIGRSIADAMGRKYVRIALGGVRDEAEVRGHRRTYVGSMPGRILQGLIDCGARNPVVLLDEIDKMGVSHQGDPTSALLEALDPEQNERFSDHYVEAPFDLSAVMFLATANLLDNVAPALRDRMEIIPFPSYTDAERTAIAREFLLPRAVEEHGLKADQVELPDASLRLLVHDYTREAGVRDLGRQIAALCRKAARVVAEGKETHVVLDEDRVLEFLKNPRYRRRAAPRPAQIGSAWAMVVSEAGGDLLPIEVAIGPVMGDRPELRLTGNLGQVMQESAQAALTAIRSRLDPDLIRQDVHVHVPEAATPKDGPSAGVTIAVALASAMEGKAIRGDVSMTGEITLRGEVLPVGGISEKVLAAARSGMNAVVLPADNRPDVEDTPQDAIGNLQIRYVRTLDEVFDHVFAPGAD